MVSQNYFTKPVVIFLIKNKIANVKNELNSNWEIFPQGFPGVTLGTGLKRALNKLKIINGLHCILLIKI